MPKTKIGRIALFTIGGTIDKNYSLFTETLYVGPPFAPKYLRNRIPPSMRIHHRQLMNVDSLFMDDGARARIVQECYLVRAEHIIITHGTGTMLETASALYRAGIGKDHTVMLTGAWRPAALRISDAERNLDLALAALFKRPPGIYIAVGRVFRWDQCIRDANQHRFVRCV